MTQSPCTDFDEKGIVGRYVAGTSTAAETEAFEQHLVGCAECQRSVRLGTAVRRSLVDARGHGRSRRLALGIAAFAAAAALMLIVGSSMLGGRQVRALGELSSVPAYGGIPVRGDLGRADSLFGEGMRFYAEGRYADATRLLVAARASGADSTPTSFFLGAVAMVERRDDDAVREFATVIRQGDTPYLGEAHFYAAQAWLRQARADSARPHLAAASQSQGPIAAEARRLAARLAEVTR